jgi:hypothetical protein
MLKKPYGEALQLIRSANGKKRYNDDYTKQVSDPTRINQAPATNE